MEKQKQNLKMGRERRAAGSSEGEEGKETKQKKGVRCAAYKLSVTPAIIIYYKHALIKNYKKEENSCATSNIYVLSYLPPGSLDR